MQTTEGRFTHSLAGAETSIAYTVMSLELPVSELRINIAQNTNLMYP